jgi:hypothetical protein
MAALTDKDYADIAALLKVDVATVKAVTLVESAGGGFLPDGRLKILFEPHIFHRQTHGRWDREYPHLSYRRWGSRPYGGMRAQWPKLEAAMKLDGVGALRSASYGLFQICGFNHRQCGFPTVTKFFESLKTGEAAHLAAFAEYIRFVGLDDELRRREWAAFAYRYNGPSFRRNRYDAKLAAAYARFRGGRRRSLVTVATPDESLDELPDAVRDLQDATLPEVAPQSESSPVVATSPQLWERLRTSTSFATNVWLQICGVAAAVAAWWSAHWQFFLLVGVGLAVVAYALYIWRENSRERKK